MDGTHPPGSLAEGAGSIKLFQEIRNIVSVQGEIDCGVFMGQIIARAGQQIRNMEGGFRFRGLKDDGGNAAGLQHTQPRNGAGQGGGILVYRNRQHTAASALGIGDVPALFIFDLEQRPAGSLGLAGVGFVASGVVAMGGFRAVFGIGRIVIVNVIREVMSQLASGIGNGIRCGAAALSIADTLGRLRPSCSQVASPLET